ncbi:MAG: Rrf2 family transcriptional regulator [Anaerolineae bacterium]|nr:Rrf2 family transcriptional regulator [Anaerolineae bacterium]
MQITRQADYAVRAVQFLSGLENGDRATTKNIAEAQDIPPSFLAKIIAQLTVVGLLETTRGVRGGVSLARVPDDISLLEVVEAIDGPVTVNACVHDHYNCSIENCPVRSIWCEVQTDLVDRLKSTKFSQFLVTA